MYTCQSDSNISRHALQESKHASVLFIDVIQKIDGGEA